MASKKITLIILLLFTMLISAYATYSVAIGASPASLSFKLPQQGYEEKTFQVSTNSDSDLPFNLEVDKSLKDIITITSSKEKTNVKQAAEITIKASAANIKPGNYSGAITVSTVSSAESTGATGSRVSAGVAVKIDVEITGETAAPEQRKPAQSLTGNAVAKPSLPIQNDLIGAIIIIAILVAGMAIYTLIKMKR